MVGAGALPATYQKDRITRIKCFKHIKISANQKGNIMNEQIINFQEAYFAKHGRYCKGMGAEWDQKNAELDLALEAIEEVTTEVKEEGKRLAASEECSKGTGVMGKYGKTSLLVNGKWIDERVSVWTAANGPVPKGMAVGNSCYNKWCCTLSHLETFGKRF